MHFEISEDGSGMTSGDVSLWIRGDGELDRGNCRLELGGVGSRTDGGPLTKDIPTSITNRMWGILGSQNPNPSIDEMRDYPGTTSLDGACATRRGQLIPAVFPVVVELATVAAASKGNERVGAADSPEHA